MLLPDLNDKIFNQILDYDREYPEFYSKLSNEPDRVQYCCSSTLSDMATFSSVVPFPKDVSIHYTTATLKASFGCLAEIGRFYCITDNKLFLWSSTDSFCEQIQEEDASVITSVCLCGVDPILLGYIPDVKFTLVLATPKYIKIIPVSGPRIDFSQFYLTEINFAPFCIAAGQDGRIFVGGECGQIFLLRFDVDNYKARSIAYNYSVTDWVYGVFPRLLKATVGFQTPSIVHICFDASFSYLAAIDDQSHVRFFNFEASSDSCTVLSIDDIEQLEIASICSVPPIDPENPHFIAFCKNGKRICFGKKVTEKHGSTKFGIVSEKDPPPELGDDQVVSAQSFMGLTIFLCKKSAIILRSQRYSEFDICEFVAVQTLPGTGLALGSANIDFSYTDPLIWQHNHEPPISYILTAAGGYKCTFSTPSETLTRLIVTNHGFIKNDVVEWFSNFYEQSEPIANALLSCFQCPENSNWALFIASQYSQQFSQSMHSLMIDGLALRVARILQPLFHSIIMFEYTSKKNEQKWRVSQPFKDLSPMVIVQLDNVNYLMKKYIENQESSTETILIQTNDVFSAEKYHIKKLSSFVDFAIEILKFLGLIGQQKKALCTAVIKMFVESAQSPSEIEERQNELDYLVKIPFYSCLFDDKNFRKALRICNRIIFTEITPTNDMNNFARQLAETCPSLSNETNAKFQISNAIDRLEAVLLSDPDTQKLYLPLVVNTFIEYSGEFISKENLKSVVSKLIQLNAIDSAISILEAKFVHIDPSNRALAFFKDGYDTQKDPIGQQFFDQVYSLMNEPLDQIISEKNGLESLMKSKYELIHIFTFGLLMEQPETLIRLNSPYLKEYIKDYKIEYYWKYLLVHNDMKAAYKELIRLAKETGEKRAKDRLEWLNMALSYAQKCNASYTEIDEIQKFAICAKLQNEVQGDDTKSQELMNFQQIAKCAAQQNKYDVALKALSLQPMKKLDVNELKDIEDQARVFWEKLLDENLQHNELQSRIVKLSMSIKRPNIVIENHEIVRNIFTRLSEKTNTEAAYYTLLRCNFNEQLLYQIKNQL
ncbi:hypothetical protein TRFO_13447 [Tritrichomonas foetus]|uniref:Nucleoporin Nup133/Nup155-like N-terminal domain-containing protein n=1 Tax=Tritrichomonas foetus TaxID=1144522 RepID=A0A1J4KXZ2_9EUKA|nr:hypothetical protein TRFO_13447 [Tritrichomonas foetus]|eukprot:OHT16121.1 hypothetical protein TRFO_13447 [Tritrichomonas foetus]